MSEGRHSASVITEMMVLTAAQFVHQILQCLQIRRFLRLCLSSTAINAARNTAAVKRELACELIETFARAPAFVAALRKRPERGAHATENGSDLLVLFARQKTAIEIDDEKLPHHLTFAVQSKTDHDEH